MRKNVAAAAARQAYGPLKHNKTFDLSCVGIPSSTGTLNSKTSILSMIQQVHFGNTPALRKAMSEQGPVCALARV